MSKTLEQRLARRVMATLLTTLLAVGGGTGALLHVRAIAALDGALLAAADAHVVPHDEQSTEHQDGVRRSIPVGFVTDGHRTAAWRDEVAGSAQPLLRDVDGVRYLMLDLATREPSADIDALPGRFVVAWSPRVRLADSVGPFALAYAALAGAALLLVRLALGPLLRDALSPLRRAAETAEQVSSWSPGHTLAIDGPPEVRSLLAAIDGLLGRLTDAAREQARFSADAAHELRTPVTALLGQLEVTLRRDRDAATYRQAIEHAADEARRMASLVEALLALSRLDADAASTRTAQPLHALLGAAVVRATPLLEQARVTLQVHLEARPDVAAHGPLVVAALANLLQNIARHAPGTSAAVTLGVHEGSAVIDVRDDGPGIDAALTERVFARFHTGDAHGHGLGLPLSRDVARAHGGDCVALPAPAGAHLRWSIPALIES